MFNDDWLGFTDVDNKERNGKKDDQAILIP